MQGSYKILDMARFPKTAVYNCTFIFYIHTTLVVSVHRRLIMCPERVCVLDFYVHVYIRCVAEESETSSTVFSIKIVLLNCNFQTETTILILPFHRKYRYVVYLNMG
jgi:hypothetical protein